MGYGRYSDIDPRDIDPETNQPYAGYSSPSLDTSFHAHEMANDDDIVRAPSEVQDYFECLDRRESIDVLWNMLTPEARQRVIDEAEEGKAE